MIRIISFMVIKPESFVAYCVGKSVLDIRNKSCKNSIFEISSWSLED